MIGKESDLSHEKRSYLNRRASRRRRRRRVKQVEWMWQIKDTAIRSNACTHFGAQESVVPKKKKDAVCLQLSEYSYDNRSLEKDNLR